MLFEIKQQGLFGGAPKLVSTIFGSLLKSSDLPRHSDCFPKAIRMPNPKLPRNHKPFDVKLPSLAQVARFALLAAMVLVAVSLVMDSAKAIAQSPAGDVAITVDAADTPGTAVADAHAGNPDHGAHGDQARAGELHGEEPQPGILSNLITLLMLILLQAVLGFDNLLYISLESRRAPADKQKMVRLWGIGLAIFLRIGLLLVLLKLIKLFQNNLFDVPEFLNPHVEGHFNGHSLIVLAGGAFILYTAVKEVLHMVTLEDHGHQEEKKPKSVFSVIFWIVLMNLVFSFDSILSAMALTHVFWVMAIAIVVGGILMIVLADTISTFLEKNRMYEVLGLFILFIVGVMLVSEGGHLAHLSFFGSEVTPMTKTTFYFVIGVLVVVDIVQGRYQKKLMAKKNAKHSSGHA